MCASIARYMHAYTSELAKYGVSRIRVHDEQHTPKGSVWIDLVEYEVEEEGDKADTYEIKNYILGADTAENVLWPVVCIYKVSCAEHADVALLMYERVADHTLCTDTFAQAVLGRRPRRGSNFPRFQGSPVSPNRRRSRRVLLRTLHGSLRLAALHILV